MTLAEKQKTPAKPGISGTSRGSSGERLRSESNRRWRICNAEAGPVSPGDGGDFEEVTTQATTPGTGRPRPRRCGRGMVEPAPGGPGRHPRDGAGEPLRAAGMESLFAPFSRSLCVVLSRDNSRITSGLVGADVDRTAGGGET